MARVFIFSMVGKLMNLTLRELNLDDEAAFFNVIKGWDSEELSWFTFEWKPGVSFKDHLEQLRKSSAGEGLPESIVPSTMLYGFVDGGIVGRVNVRHELNDNLRKRGGHIGYYVASDHRRKGYALEMVKQSLPLIQELGVQEILVTCASDNIPSWKIIERIGGTLEKETFDERADEMIRHYWVKL